MTTPKWAQELILDASLYLESKGYAAVLPDITWRHGSKFQSSGHASRTNHITITAGRDRLDAKLVLLHEYAHIHAKPAPGSHIWHSGEFWNLAWDLYRWAKLPIRYCQQREYSYKVGAQVGYRRNRKSRG
jgi:hypothetical protein